MYLLSVSAAKVMPVSDQNAPEAKNMSAVSIRLPK